VASNKLYPQMLEQPDKDAEAMANELNLIQVGDDDFIYELVGEVIKANPEKVEEYKNGKKGLIGMFMGEVMKKSQGKADPKKANQIMQEELEKVTL
jgi:aspartyl-tRNA(Asn)/glutamyl-tRNA(Gln) amidotransferase subunit B